MDLQTIINGMLASGSALVAWFARELWSTTKDQASHITDLRREISDLKEEIAMNRVHREDFREAMREVKEMLNRIIEKLDKKVDK